jgi:hypothetical protein
MKRLLCLALVATLAVLETAPAHASITRLLSIGVDNWQVHDSANFWSNPALFKDVPDMVHFEVGAQPATAVTAAGQGPALTAGSQWGGFHKAWGRHVFGVYIRRPYGTNDFSGIANPLLTPQLGGMVTNASVTGNAALDAGGFGATGPFGTLGGATILGLTGAPASINAATLDMAAPVNFVDLFYAVPMGPVAFGMQFNFARNAPGENRRNAFSNLGSGLATTGTAVLERKSTEFNIRPGMSIKGEKTRLDVTGQITLPFFSMEYRETDTTGRFARSNIDDRDTLGGGIGVQLTSRVREQSTLSLRIRAGRQNAAGTASSQADTALGGALEIDQRANFDNKRSYVGGDVTWNQLWDRALLVASIGYTRMQTLQTWGFTDVVTPGNNQADSNKVDIDVVPLRLGIELRPWERVALRAGVQKNWFAESDTVNKDVDGNTPASTSGISTALGEATGTANGVGLSFGLGFKIIRGLTIDTVVRQIFFFDGPNFGGGRRPGMFAQGTLVYRFGLSSNQDDTLKPLLSYDEIQLY